jgi:predicted GIY-YIG superfamily endonuclease
MNKTVYALIDPRSRKVRYVGCSHDIQKRLKQHCTNPAYRLYKWIRELASYGMVPKLKKLEEFSSKHEAYKQERYWINVYEKRGHLPLNKNKANFPSTITR